MTKVEKAIPDYLNRMYLEFEELCSRITKLDAYFTLHFGEMQETEMYLMKKQRKAMSEYRNVLQKRIVYCNRKEGIM